MKPYYQDKWVTIILGNCREFALPKCEAIVITDPPYPDQHLEYGDSDISFLGESKHRQLIFWSAKVEFPLDYTAIHIWDKQHDCRSQYERIFERNGQCSFKVFNYGSLDNRVSAQMSRDVFTEHPSQKPQKLMNRLIADFTKVGDLIYDPFLGSGTTAYCAKKLNRHCIGIEIEEKYCEIAAKRCSQSVMELNI